MLIDFLFPQQSLAGEEGQWITEEELTRLVPSPRIFTRSELSANGIKYVDQLFAVSSYHHCPLLKKAIRSFKYRRIMALSEVLRHFLVDGITQHYQLQKNACLCPVPLHWSRKFQRGFNQAEILSHALGDACNLPVRHLLIRTRPTGHQARRNRQQRLNALTKAFRASPVEHTPSHVYLIDDLFTTGATMEECAKALKESGVERVEGVALAYG